VYYSIEGLPYFWYNMASFITKKEILLDELRLLALLILGVVLIIGMILHSFTGGDLGNVLSSILTIVGVMVGKKIK